jgi:hypothetical protein
MPGTPQNADVAYGTSAAAAAIIGGDAHEE